jgi:predicted nuclease with RNAse H fold
LITVGIDLAAQPENTAACVVNWTRSSAVVEQIETDLDDKDIVDLISRADKAGIDVPLGWPVDFINAITAHLHGKPWPGHPFRRLRFRETDRFVFDRTAHWPLSVSTDRIGIPAMRAAALLSKMGETADRLGMGRVVEVYPSAALRRWGFDPARYKGKKGLENRRHLVKAFQGRTSRWLRLPDCYEDSCNSSDNAFDALVAALVTRAGAIKLTEPVPPESDDFARKEGWIALPLVGSLDKLAEE